MAAGNHKSFATGAQARNPFVELGNIRPELLGIVFHVTWIFLLLYNVIPGAQPVLVAGIVPFYTLSLAALSATALVVAFNAKGFVNRFYSGRGVFAAAGITFAGTLASFASVWVRSSALVVVAGVLTGVGSTFIAALWASAFARMSLRKIVVNLPTILVLSSIACFDGRLLPVVPYTIVVCALPLLSGLALRSSIKMLGFGRLKDYVKQDFGDNDMPVRPKSVLLVMGLLLVLLGFAEDMPNSLTSGIAGNATIGSASFYAVLILAVLTLVGMGIRRIDHNGVLPLYWMPIIGFAAYSIPLVLCFPDRALDAICDAGLVCQEIVLIAGTTAIALNFRMPPIRTFLLARIIFGLSSLAGQLLGANGLYRLVAGQTGIITVAMMEVGIAIVTIVFYLMHRYNATHVTLEDPIASNRTNVQIESACDAIANAYHLSPREREVFQLMAEGRSTSRIMEQLCIAEGTVNTHSRNIYRKLGVHSRQEMIDMVYSKMPERES